MKSAYIKGFTCAAGAYIFWGFFPLFWRLLAAFSPWEILIHRILWSFVFYYVVVFTQGKTAGLKNFLKSPRLLLLTLASSLLIAINWVVFIWAINNGHTVDSSLGYFISPILSILMGIVFFKETLTRNKWIALVITVSTVLWLIFSSPYFPWVALSLAITFSLYGVIRKVSKSETILHSTFESGLIVPFAIIAAPWICTMNPLTAPLTPTLLLALGGILTGFILWIFAIGAQNLDYSTMGFLQFISPFLQFLTGIFVFKEQLSQQRLIAFILIWIAIAIVLQDIFAQRKLRNKTLG